MSFSGCQFIFLKAMEESAQKVARSPSHRGKYFNLIAIPKVSSKLFNNSKTVVPFPTPIFNILNLSILLSFKALKCANAKSTT